MLGYSTVMSKERGLPARVEVKCNASFKVLIELSSELGCCFCLGKSNDM